MAPQRAAELMRAGKLHAYVGDTRQSAFTPSDKIGTVESLGSFVIVRLNPDSAVAKHEASTCAAAAAIVRDMSASGGGLIVHPYPVTPFHGDYLNHADRAEAARQRLLSAAHAPRRHQGARHRRLAKPRSPGVADRRHLLGCRDRGGCGLGPRCRKHAGAEWLARAKLGADGLVSGLSPARGRDGGTRRPSRRWTLSSSGCRRLPTRDLPSASTGSGSSCECCRRVAGQWSPATR